MTLCEEIKNVALELLPLEEERIKIAGSLCRNKILSQCDAHDEKEREMLYFYNIYKNKSDQLLASL